MEQNSTQPYNILIVDDNPKNIQVLGTILREAGYLAGFATDGRQALTLLQNNPDYDLVLLDVEMPVMNGYETCQAMRRDDNLKEIPVIFLTAYSEISNVVNGFEAGAQDYITKPFNSRELLARVDTHLQLKRKNDLIKQMNFDLEQTVEQRTDELKMAYNEVHKLNNLKTDFLILLSQEIRNPLNGVIGTINLIKNQEHSPAIITLLETLDISLSKLENFAYKVMLYTQLTSKKYSLQNTENNLKEMVQFSIIELNELIQSSNCQINISSIPDNAIVRGDRELIFKSFVYVIHNAIQHSPPDGIVSVEVRSLERQIVCSVCDGGVGFSNELLNREFLPFRFEDGMLDPKGGLSLYIVKQIMDMHNGQVRIFNKAKAGGCVELIFNI
jgi:two-component system, sensor histidine kinase and response regulator